MPATRHNHWGLFDRLRRPRRARVKQLRLNLGAPGDKVDRDGSVWHAFPRPFTDGPRGAGGMAGVPKDRLPVELAGDPKSVRKVSRNPDWISIANTDKPWLYSCALVGPTKLTITLGPEGMAARPHRVKMHFCELDGALAGGRFSVIAQGQTVLSNVAIRELAGGGNRALVKTVTVEAGSALTLDIVPAAGATASVCALEVVMQ